MVELLLAGSSTGQNNTHVEVASKLWVVKDLVMKDLCNSILQRVHSHQISFPQLI
jgi:hypothetical protein